MNNNIIVTTCNDLYYKGCLTLISSIHKHNKDIADKIYVYNLNMSPENVKFLNSLYKVETIEYPEYLTKDFYPEYLEPSQKGYKLFCFDDASRLGRNVLWMDAGSLFLKDFSILFDIIEKQHIFVVIDSEKSLINEDWTSEECKRIMKCTKKELKASQVHSNILGYQSGQEYQFLFKEAFDYSKIKDCVFGPKWGKNQHRWDQSIISILVSRYNIAGYRPEVFACHISNNAFTNQVVFVSRTTFIDYNYLLYKEQ